MKQPPNLISFRNSHSLNQFKLGNDSSVIWIWIRNSLKENPNWFKHWTNYSLIQTTCWKCFQIWILSDTEKIQVSKNIKYHQSVWGIIRDIPYKSSLLTPFPFLSLTGIQHGCVVSRILWSEVFWLIWPPSQNTSHTLPLIRQRELPSFID